MKTNQVAGTGLTHYWNKSRELIQILDKPTFLAGGLNPENVEQAIKLAQPYGVDVNSGCKNDKGVKDKEKVRKFIINAKGISLIVLRISSNSTGLGITLKILDVLKRLYLSEFSPEITIILQIFFSSVSKLRLLIISIPFIEGIFKSSNNTSGCISLKFPIHQMYYIRFECLCLLIKSHNKLCLNQHCHQLP